MACCGAKRGGSKGSQTQGEKCDDCRGWEEELYWKRFQPLHFCQILRPATEFHKHLGIPKKFARNAKAILPPKVTLRGPSGASWCATMIKKGDELFLSDGWEEFVKAYTLQANSILIFKYDGNSVFDVLIFDGENLCEKESGYFVKKCVHADPFTERQKKRVSSEADIEENNDNPIRKAAKQAKKDAGKKVVDESPKLVGKKVVDESPKLVGKKVVDESPKLVGKKVVDESPKLDCSHSNGKTGRKKSAPRKSVSSKAKERERTPVTSSENLCDSFAMLAELGKTIVENVTSYMEPENTMEINGSRATESPNQDTAPKLNGSVSTTASGRGRKAGYKKSLNEASLLKAASTNTELNGSVSTKASGRGRKVVGSPGKQKSSKKKVASSVVPHKMQPSAAGAMDLIPYGSADRPKRTYVSEPGKVAVEMARKQMTDRSFLLVLRPTNVYKRFMVTVPPQWFRKHLPPNSQEVFLRLEDKTWLTKLGYSPCKGTGQICGGWKQFVHDNHLEEFDVCVFTLASQKDNATMLDVSIFRAGPTMATPLNQVITDDTIIITPLEQVVVDDTPMLIIE